MKNTITRHFLLLALTAGLAFSVPSLALEESTDILWVPEGFTGTTVATEILDESLAATEPAPVPAEAVAEDLFLAEDPSPTSEEQAGLALLTEESFPAEAFRIETADSLPPQPDDLEASATLESAIALDLPVSQDGLFDQANHAKDVLLWEEEPVLFMEAEEAPEGAKELVLVEDNLLEAAQAQEEEELLMAAGKKVTALKASWISGQAPVCLGDPVDGQAEVRPDGTLFFDVNSYSLAMKIAVTLVYSDGTQEKTTDFDEENLSFDSSGWTPGGKNPLRVNIGGATATLSVPVTTLREKYPDAQVLTESSGQTISSQEKFMVPCRFTPSETGTYLIRFPSGEQYIFCQAFTPEGKPLGFSLDGYRT